MRAAEKTINFVKEWINGTYTKRQYQNYYIVRTPHAQFLMKQTENRELLAIKDTTGHIYLFDDELPIQNYGEVRIYETDAMSNPFLCLIAEDYQFAYTRVSPQSLHRQTGSPLSNLSKWKTLDRVEVSNPSLPAPLYLSLVELGDYRYYISPIIDTEIPASARKMSLKAWALHSQEASHKFPNKWPLYNFNILYSNKINTVGEIKNNYLGIAGDEADKSWVTYEGWVFIPTAFESIEQITGRPFKEAKRTRPSPYAYGLHGNNVNPNQMYRRFETVDENIEALKECINMREPFDSSDWKDKMRMKFLPEVAQDIIDYFEADDAWLREHFEIAKAGHMESQFRSKIAIGFASSLMFINKETNLSPLGDYVVYLKAPGLIKDKFMKIIPVPSMANKVKGLFDGD